MAFLDWLLVGAVGLLLNSARKDAKAEREKQEREIERIQKEQKKLDAAAEKRRKETIRRKKCACRFTDGISEIEFAEIAQNTKKKIKRVTKVDISGPYLHCAATSQSGISDWDFYLDFNDWGHITGKFWVTS